MTDVEIPIMQPSMMARTEITADDVLRVHYYRAMILELIESKYKGFTMRDEKRRELQREVRRISEWLTRQVVTS
jgi:hypothetical protein